MFINILTVFKSFLKQIGNRGKEFKNKNERVVEKDWTDSGKKYSLCGLLSVIIKLIDYF